ncbi:OmpA family protein [Rhizobium sp. RAF56]|uniref:OmpA family protein n=1 Tax=Rhizobium sp. RAF56 TaxID=3233062 RepID=UPI003F97F5E4
MGTRSRLFASAAFPLLSLSLMLQPAGAALLREPAVAPVSVAAADVQGADGIEVAQEQTQPEQPQPPAEPQQQAAPEQAPAAAEEELKPKHKQHAAEGQGEAQPAPVQAEQPQAPAAPAQPEAQPVQAQEEQQPHKKHKQQEEPAALAQPAVEQQQAAPAPVEQQPPKKHQKQQEQSAEPAPPAAEVQQQAAPAPAEQQPPKKHQKKQEQSAEPAQPAAEGQQQAEPAPAEQQPPKKHQKKQQEQSAEPAQPAAEPTQPAAEGQQQAAPAPAEQQPPKKHQKKQEQSAEPAQPAGEAPAQTEGAKEAVQPQPAQQPPAPEKAAAPAENTPAPAEPTAPAKAEAAPAAPSGGVQEAAPLGGEQVSPAELERRKKIAENPAASTGPVILPVQNGAAVLDSDKDAARRGHRGQRQNGQQNGQQDGQGQAAQPAAPATVRAPTSDADAQRVGGGNQAPVRIEAVTSEQGRRLDRRPSFAAPQGAQIQDSRDNRVIMNYGDGAFVRHDDSRRFTRDGERPVYEELARDRYRETIARPDGDRIVTVRNRYGDVIQRSRIDARGREYVLFYSPELEDQRYGDDYFRDPGDELPPMRLRIPLNQYIIDTSGDRNRDYYDFLREPPVEPVERVYSLNEVRYSARIRDKVRRIDLDTITFATGSADIPMAQAKTLRGIADAISKIVEKEPSETFLIEGHTDAVGAAQSNLILSDERAESVANLLTDVYGIPPENLTTQGYGEQYLKVNTAGPEQENRRVTIRRVTALVRPVAQRD